MEASFGDKLALTTALIVLCQRPHLQFIGDFLHHSGSIPREGEMRNGVAECVANDEEQARLGLFPGEMVYRLDRVRARGQMLFVENVRLAAGLFPHLQKPISSICDLAHTHGLQLGEALETVCAVPASADIAKALGVADRTLVLMLDRVVHLRDGRPAEWRITYRLDQENLTRLLARL
jgi:DNA-binding GntR family transcriptional regulator